MEKWKLTSFDTFCLGMTIKGAWIYDRLPSFDVLSSSFQKMLEMYPHLLGHYNAKEKSVEWDENCAPVSLQKKSYSRRRIKRNPYRLAPKYDIRGFKKGKVPAISACLLELKDGAALVVQGAHACMDGQTFYTFMRQWAELARGGSVTPMVVNQGLLPSADFYSKEETLVRVKERGWVKIGLGQVFKMLANLSAMKLIRRRYVMEVSQEEIARMRAESGAGTNAVLCSLACRKLLAHNPKQESFALLEVADLRGRACGVPENFFGNFSQPVVAGSYDTAADPHLIHEDVRFALRYEGLSENVQLSLCSSRHGLPYFYFDASDMNSRKPKLYYVNNQLKFRTCELDFGTGKPLRARDAELADMIKFWQPVSGGPVQVIYGGFAARTMRKKIR